jgi:nucleotidyltransferase/DNA polymerase involved in DNA repair
MIVFVVFPRFYLKGENPGAKLVISRNRLVLEASDEAFRRGIQVGISTSLARRRCPGLEVRDFKPEDYSNRFEQVWSVIAQFTPSIESTDLHQGYLDVARDIHRFGNLDMLINSLQEEMLRKTGMRFDWGGGSDKWMAWLARGHNQCITPNMESLVLQKLPIESMALPGRIVERLHHFDIHTVAQVMNLPLGFLQSHLGFDRTFVLKCLTRHKETVRPNFPPPRIEARVDVTEFDEHACQRAIIEAAKTIATQLMKAAVQTSCLRITYKTKARKHELNHKLSQGVLSEERLTKILLDLLPEGMQSNLKHISVVACDLLPRQVTQYLLWEKSIANNAGEQLERAQNKLHNRYGIASLVTGNVAYARQQPRFAQLIYQTRGLTLP